MPRLKIFHPDQFLHFSDAGAPDTEAYRYGFLAQGDSWFSIGALPPFQTTNYLFEMELAQSAYAVNCANPGDHLSHMLDARRDPQFRSLLAGKLAYEWDAILLSAGGNDLIDAAAILPRYSDGSLVPPEKRLLRRKDEWSGSGVARYISGIGLEQFRIYLIAQFHALVTLRDSDATNRGVPIFVHCYDYIMPRDAPVRFVAGKKTWLFPAVNAYEIPQEDWLGVSIYLLDFLKTILQDLRLPALHVVDTTNTLMPASAGSTGSTPDWENEIHPTKQGYAKLAKIYSEALDEFF